MSLDEHRPCHCIYPHLVILLLQHPSQIVLQLFPIPRDPADRGQLQVAAALVIRVDAQVLVRGAAYVVPWRLEGGDVEVECAGFGSRWGGGLLGGCAGGGGRRRGEGWGCGWR